jgi:RNA recognition motif-containing protein
MTDRESKLYVGNLDYGTTDSDLQDYFARFGGVEKAIVIMDRETGRSRGFGFVTMADETALEEVLKIEAHELSGRNLKVNRAQQQQNRDRRRF